MMSPADDIVEEKDVFTIHHKNDNFDSLRQWRKATLALNATRRFRYTLDLKKAEEARNVLSRRVKAGAHTRQVVKHFQDAGNGKLTGSETSCSFGVGPEKLQELVKGQDLGFLHQLGGVFGLAEALHANVDEGLAGENDDIVSRKSYFGENNYPRSKPKGFWVFVWEACQDTTLMILMLCAVISLVTGMTSKDEGVKAGWYDGTSISCAILAVILVTAISDYKQSLEFQVLTDEKKNILVQALRAGRALKISIFDLVVGDIVLLNIGDQVPADGVLIKGHSLAIDESSLTGESEHVLKDPMHPFLLSGCKVADGHGVMLVTGVGLRTEWGQIMASISEDIGEETPLQVRLNGTATLIGKIGVIVAVLVFIILFVRYFTDEYNKNMKASDVASKIADIFAIAVVIVVIAVPEGLPLAVTLTLAYSMRKMMEDNSLVRHLSACETMGCATYICSDKTGTLTMNEMTVVEAWVAGKVCKENYTTSPAVFDKLVEGIAQNSNGMVSLAKGGDFEVIGSPTEKALLKWGLDIGMNYKHIKSAASILKMEAFNSIRKTAGVAVMHTNGNVIIHWKGAAEVILDRCTHWLNNDGAVNQMDDEMACHLREVISQMGASSLRCIAFAYQELPRESIPECQEQLTTWSLPDQNLIIIAITGIKDPCRREVKQAVSECKRAGVKVCMVTGDNLMTAISIARECGIYSEDGMAIEGSTFRNYNNDEMMACLTRIQVLARSLPSDKLLLVKKLKEVGEVVAVTGDGTNDAPALHEADIGLAMGISGTEVAKESSDVIILDDNFLSVVKMVKWGRSVYSNIQKFIQFQLTVNVSALAVNFIASTTDGSVPLQTVQMLWVNLIMDTLGALALATERPTDDLMHRPSIGLRDPLVTNIMWRNLLGQAAFQLTAMLIVYYKGITLFSLERKIDRDRIRDTIIFNAFVFCQLFNEINARKLENFNVFSGITKNKIFIAVIFLSAVFQVIMVEVLNKFAKTSDLTWSQWLICIGIGSLSLPVGSLLKTIKVPKKPIIRIHRSRRRNARESEGQQQPTQPEGSEAV